MPYELVVIGASLGGLNALKTVLKGFPADFPAAIAIVQHRTMNEVDQLTNLLQKYCVLPLQEAEDKTVIQGGHVYFAPADYHLLVNCDMQNPQSEKQVYISLSTEAPVNFARPSIDVLFESAANALGEKVIGVLLTGSNKDGALGLNFIQQRNGLTVVQDPRTAQSRDMPNAAIQLKSARLILPLGEISDFIVDNVIKSQGRTNRK